MPFFSAIAVSLYKQYYISSISYIIHLNKCGRIPMVLSVRFFKEVGKSTRHKNCKKIISFDRYSTNRLGNVFKGKEITGLEDFNVSLPFAICLKPSGFLDIVLSL